MGRFAIASRMVLAGLLVLLCQAYASAAAPTERRVALVIGNSDYVHAPKLRNPRNDAEDLTAKLSALGFEVVEGFDLDKVSMVETLKAFGDALPGADVALVFYAGHGIQVDGQNYLVPTDAEVEHEDEIGFELIAFNQVMRQMERGGDRIKLAFLDACRDNPFKDMITAADPTRAAVSLAKGLGEMRAPRGTFIAFATEPDQVAADGSGRNSPFTASLVEHMGDPGASIQDVMIRVRRDVSTETNGQQTPWDSSSLMESFSFAPASGGETTAQAPVQAQAPSSSTAAREDFNLAMQIGTCGAAQAFLETHPSAGMLSVLAREKAAELCAAPVADVERAVAEEPVELAMTMRTVRPAGTCADGPDGVAYCATSVLDAIGANRYGPEMLFDGRGETAWVENDAADGIGETITLDFGRERQLLGFEISNGYDKDQKVWANNSRVARFDMEIGSAKLAGDLPDARGVQRFEFGRAVATSSLMLTIREVFPGDKYRDTAISELRPIFGD